MKYIFNDKRTIDLLQASAPNAEVRFAPFFFHHRGGTLQHSYIGLLRTVLSYILTDDDRLYDCMVPILREFEKWQSFVRAKKPVEPDFWTYNRLKRALDIILDQQVFRLNLCLLFDALDEFDGQPETIGQYIKSMVLERPGSLTRVKICISSREWDGFTKLFRHLPGFALQDHTRSDMQEFCQQTIFAAEGIDRQALTSLREELVQKAAGVFLWLRLVLGDLIKAAQRTRDASTLRVTLESLPVELENYYMVILDRIPSAHKWEAFALLEVGARRIGQQYFGGEIIMERSIDTAFLCRGAVECSACSTYTEAKRELQWMTDKWPTRSIPLDEFELYVQRVSAGLVEVIKVTRDSRSECAGLQLMHQTVLDVVLGPKLRQSLLPSYDLKITENGYSCAAKFILAYYAFSPEMRPRGGITWDRLIFPAYLLRQSEAVSGLSQQSFIDSVDHEYGRDLSNHLCAPVDEALCCTAQVGCCFFVSLLLIYKT